MGGHQLKVVTNDRLLGGHMCFTAKRVVWLANKRANPYIETAKRIWLCPLPVEARALLLATAGATKYTFGLELAAANIHLERTLRTEVLAALWNKRRKNALTLVFPYFLKVMASTLFN